MADPHVVIVGGGQAGGRCAEALRSAGHRGRITIVADEPRYPYERPALSKEFLDGVIEPAAMEVRPEQWYADNAIDVHTGVRVARLDRTGKSITLASGACIPYDVAVLAVGSRPRHLPAACAGDLDLHYLRDTDDSRALRARLLPGVRVAIVGAGLLGLEIAACAARKGCAVDVVEQGARVMDRVVAPAIGELCASTHRAHGVRLHTGATLRRVERRERGFALDLADGREIMADVVAVAIGVVPNIELARDAGLEVSDGIVVDEYGATNDPCVYAIGDCARFRHPPSGRMLRLETWSHAQNHAIAVARNIAGTPRAYDEIPWGWSTQFDMRLQFLGSHADGDRSFWRGDPATGRAVLLHLNDNAVVGACGINMPREVRKVRGLITGAVKVDPLRLADPEVELDKAIIVETGGMECASLQKSA